MATVHIVVGFLPTCGGGSLDWLSGYSRRASLSCVHGCSTVLPVPLLPPRWLWEPGSVDGEDSLVLELSTQPNRCSWFPWRPVWGRQSAGPPWSPCLCVWTCSQCVSVVCFLLCLKMNRTRPALEHLPKITVLWPSGISEFTSPGVDIGGCALSDSQLLSDSAVAVCQDPCLWLPALELRTSCCPLSWL